ncbi:beta-phosphoglucomutase [Fusibacter tunisiensis]|uniref:Beta-phosphoglucomutase n=1 Tax=Fusibacter tunisiensis TaxID=1008308 RepID=A0ABS2MQK4_9FIRM|nr:beta-phosphoglucomutase [Fusibacter tunisiensis]MBM7561679.1 beta-phosphoglucomutase [Fusibacter tunisiensis]
MLKNIKGVVFDMDGVLTETSKAHFEAWRDLSNKLGFNIPDTVGDQVRGISRLESLEIVLSYDAKKRAFTDAEKTSLTDDKNAIYLEKIKAYSKRDLAPGTLELLKYLQKKEIRIALASASRNASFLLKAMEIDSYFDGVVDPSSIKNGKPAPDIFTKAVALLGLPAEKCLGVEDAQAGIESIRSAGLIPVGIGPLEKCQYRFDTLNDFYQALLLNS